MSVELQSFKSISEVATKFGRGAVLTNSETQGVMTMRRLGNLIAQGFGQGRNDGYVPWIRVTRRYYSVCADPNLTHPADPILTRGWSLTV